MSSPNPEPGPRRDWRVDLAGLGLRPSDDIRAAIVHLAREHGVTGAREPIDAFVDAAQRLADEEVELDPVERLLVGLRREEVVTDEQGFALHAAYLDQLAAEGARGTAAAAAGGA